MNLILVSGRHTESRPPYDADARLSCEFAAAGCQVRWIVPTDDARDASETRPDEAVRFLPVASRAPPFMSVCGRLADEPIERLLAQEIRRELPDLVHLLAYGGCTSVNASWLAVRMGAPTIVSLRSAPTLCHRGDLVHADGTDCDRWNDFSRCAACCLTSSPRGLGRLGSAMGRFLGLLRSPLNPYPRRIDFDNRAQLLLGGLQVDQLVVDSEEDKVRIASLGVRDELFAVLPSPSTADWLHLYREVVDRRP